MSVGANWPQGIKSAVFDAQTDALSLLATLIMAWNTARMQEVVNHRGQRRGGSVPPELLGCLVPTRTG